MIEKRIEKRQKTVTQEDEEDEFDYDKVRQLILDLENIHFVVLIMEYSVVLYHNLK